MNVLEGHDHEGPAQHILPTRLQEINFAFEYVNHEFIVRCDVEAGHVCQLVFNARIRGNIREEVKNIERWQLSAKKVITYLRREREYLIVQGIQFTSAENSYVP